MPAVHQKLRAIQKIDRHTVYSRSHPCSTQGHQESFLYKAPENVHLHYTRMVRKGYNLSLRDGCISSLLQVFDNQEPKTYWALEKYLYVTWDTFVKKDCIHEATKSLTDGLKNLTI
ncbi:hypothetical protein DSO57_1009600 [Entomophthora muscae]|uniref:Uncharacterized protein n=1 Tax=Entomophthora muscae TaxID=34485 RepID=A0ACC2SJH0_9FUNG|nr:hypothetical protein DSO57_1009600 [Entomophthora muscae]